MSLFFLVTKRYLSYLLNIICCLKLYFFVSAQDRTKVKSQYNVQHITAGAVWNPEIRRLIVGHCETSGLTCEPATKSDWSACRQERSCVWKPGQTRRDQSRWGNWLRERNKALLLFTVRFMCLLSIVINNNNVTSFSPYLQIFLSMKCFMSRHQWDPVQWWKGVNWQMKPDGWTSTKTPSNTRGTQMCLASGTAPACPLPKLLLPLVSHDTETFPCVSTLHWRNTGNPGRVKPSLSSVSFFPCSVARACGTINSLHKTLNVYTSRPAAFTGTNLKHEDTLLFPLKLVWLQCYIYFEELPSFCPNV